jgi:hypothetical protein
MGFQRAIVRIKQRGKRISYVITLFGILVPPINAASFQINIDTNLLTGNQGQLIFDFIDGDGDINNSIRIEDFNTDGSLEPATITGDISGTLPGEVIIKDTDFFTELLQPISLSTTIDFGLNFTEHFSGGSFPDSFAFFLFDESGISSLLSTSDPTGNDALFVLDITNAGLELQNFSPTVSAQAIPEPNTLLIFGLGLMLFFTFKPSRSNLAE